MNRIINQELYNGIADDVFFLAPVYDNELHMELIHMLRFQHDDATLSKYAEWIFTAFKGRTPEYLLGLIASTCLAEWQIDLDTIHLWSPTTIAGEFARASNIIRMMENELARALEQRGLSMTIDLWESYRAFEQAVYSRK